MDNDVIISIKGSQKFSESPSEEEHSIELVTAGTYCVTPDEFVVKYMESELTGFGNTETTIKVYDNRIELTRLGQVVSQMVFEKGRKHYSVYDTPFGSLMLGVTAKNIWHTLAENGGDIAVDYTVDIDHVMTGINKFRINVRKPSPFH